MEKRRDFLTPRGEEMTIKQGDRFLTSPLGAVHPFEYQPLIQITWGCSIRYLTMCKLIPAWLWKHPELVFRSGGAAVYTICLLSVLGSSGRLQVGTVL